MKDRMPPADIRRFLRREVGFGCPIHGCSSPFLEYHHFNPPWNEGHVHNAEGMIALCPNHHAMADRGTWTIEELLILKTTNRTEQVRGKLYWNLRNSIVNAGSNYFVVQDLLSLRVLGNEIFGLNENNNGQITINALLWDITGKVIIQIVDNDILIAPDNINDFVCNVSGNKVRIESLKNHTYLEFTIKREKTRNLKAILQCFIPYENEVPIISLKARVINPFFDICIQNKQVILDFRKFGYDRTTISDRIIGPLGALNFISGGREFLYLG